MARTYQSLVTEDDVTTLPGTTVVIPAGSTLRVDGVFDGDAGTFESAVIPSGETLTIASGGALIVANGAELRSGVGGRVGAMSPLTVTSADAASLAVGRLGATTPALTVDASTASCVTGLTIKSKATGDGVELLATDSGADANIVASPKGAGLFVHARPFSHSAITTIRQGPLSQFVPGALSNIIVWWDDTNKRIVSAPGAGFFYKSSFWMPDQAPDFGTYRGPEWLTRATGTPTTNSGGSAAQLALAATNEAELAGADWGTSGPFSVEGFVCQFRLSVPVAMTGNVVAAIGMHNGHAAAFAGVSSGFWLRFDGATGSGLLARAESRREGTPDTGTPVTTGVSWTAGDSSLLKSVLFDASSTADVRIFIDGVRVAAATTFTMFEGEQYGPFFRVGKESAETSVGSLFIPDILIASSAALI